MRMILIEWLVFFSLIPALEGSREIWGWNESSFLEGIMKTILESCYKNDHSSNPVLIFGDFNEFIDGSSIIRMNSPLDINYNGLFLFKASKIILIEDSPNKLESDLILLRETQWWNHMASLFIIAKKKEACRNFKEILNITWTMDIINSIYICAESMNISVLYTLNPIANYAPHPWERMEELDDLNVFRQAFDRNISCENLNYDKTRFLNGHEVKAVWSTELNGSFVPGNNYFEQYANTNDINIQLLRFIIVALNASGRFEVVRRHDNAVDHCIAVTSDIANSCTLKTFQCSPFLFPHDHVAKIAVVRLNPEVSTLQKILMLWSTPVLIAAAIALAFLTLILTIMNHDFSLAILDLVRLLIYTAIRTGNRNHSFRIYFTTMLIFMVISNGVFQSKIASFLTKRERTKVVGTIQEFADLGYKMYTVNDHADFYNQICPKCHFERAYYRDCIQYVLNNSRHLCAIWERAYHMKYSQLDLDYNHKILSSDFAAYGCRRNWPLQRRFDDMILRIFQTGIMESWKIKQTSVPKHKRQAREAEWSSAQYRPVKLYKLKFAFQILAVGFALSAFALILELQMADHRAT